MNTNPTQSGLNSGSAPLPSTLPTTQTTRGLPQPSFYAPPYNASQPMNPPVSIPLQSSVPSRSLYHPQGSYVVHGPVIPNYSSGEEVRCLPSVRSIVSAINLERHSAYSMPSYQVPHATTHEANGWSTVQHGHAPAVAAIYNHPYSSHGYPSQYVNHPYSTLPTTQIQAPHTRVEAAPNRQASHAAPPPPPLESNITSHYTNMHTTAVDARTPAAIPYSHGAMANNRVQIHNLYESMDNGHSQPHPGAFRCHTEHQGYFQNTDLGPHGQIPPAISNPPRAAQSARDELRTATPPVPAHDAYRTHAIQQSVSDPLHNGDSDNDESGRYIAPSPNGEGGLTEAFLAQITARAFQYEDGIVQCSECGEGYGNIASWKRHASRAHRVDQASRLQCPICSIELRNEGNLKRHLETVHKDVPDQFICHHCPASFSSDRARSIHTMRIHSIPQDLPAEGGISKSNGKRIRTAAPKPKMHKCSHCEYVSKWKGNISRHIKSVHLALRPFACNECDKKFNTASNLTVHEMTHERDRERNRLQANERESDDNRERGRQEE